MCAPTSTNSRKLAALPPLPGLVKAAPCAHLEQVLVRCEAVADDRECHQHALPPPPVQLACRRAVGNQGKRHPAAQANLLQDSMHTVPACQPSPHAGGGSTVRTRAGGGGEGQHGDDGAEEQQEGHGHVVDCIQQLGRLDCTERRGRADTCFAIERVHLAAQQSNEAAPKTCAKITHQTGRRGGSQQRCRALA